MPIDRKELGEVIDRVEALCDFHYNLRLGDFMKAHKNTMLAPETPSDRVVALARQFHAEVRDHLSPSRQAAVAIATANVYVPETEGDEEDFGPPPVDKSIDPEQILAAIRAELLK